MLLKRGVLGMELGPLSLSAVISLLMRIFQNLWLLSGVFLFGISFIFYLFVLLKFHLNIVYPIMIGNGVILISIASWILFGERLTLIQIIGIILILFGIFLVMPKS